MSARAMSVNMAHAGVSPQEAYAHFARAFDPAKHPRLKGRFAPSAARPFPPEPLDPTHAGLLRGTAQGDMASRFALADYLSDRGDEASAMVLRSPDPVVVAGGGVYSQEPGPQSLVVRPTGYHGEPWEVVVTSGGKTLAFSPPRSTGGGYVSPAMEKLSALAYRLYAHHNDHLDALPHAATSLSASDLRSLQAHARRRGVLNDLPASGDPLDAHEEYFRAGGHDQLGHSRLDQSMTYSGMTVYQRDAERERRRKGGFFVPLLQASQASDFGSLPPAWRAGMVGEPYGLLHDTTFVDAGHGYTEEMNHLLAPNARIAREGRELLKVPGTPGVPNPADPSRRLPRHFVPVDATDPQARSFYAVQRRHGGRAVYVPDGTFIGWSFPDEGSMRAYLRAGVSHD